MEVSITETMNNHFVNITKELKLKPREIETKELTVRISTLVQRLSTQNKISNE